MDRNEARFEIKSRFAEYLQPAKRLGYICPLCGNGSGADGDGMNVSPTGDGTQLHCFKCGFHGDIIDLYQKEHETDAKTAFNALYSLFNISIDERGDYMTKAPKGQTEPTEAKETAKYTEYYHQCRKAITDSTAQQYLAFRGISNETATRFYIGYDKQSGFIVIPVSEHFYIARNTYHNANKRYNNPAGAKIDIFNANFEKESGLYNSNGNPVFIVEGIFDALSIIEAGGEAVALNSTANTKKLIQKLKEHGTKNTLILCLDNDEAGKKATAELTKELSALNVSFVVENICGKYKDPNEALTSDKEQFKKAVSEAITATSKPDNTASYINRIMAREIESLRRNAGRKTGYENIDNEVGSIYPGLYVVGGVPSVGKTTFIYQMADQMAETGQHVLFFSMEQSRLEMVSKSIARETAKADISRAVTSLAIRTGRGLTDFVIEQSEKYCQKVGDRMSVIEGNFNCTVSFIRQYIERYIEENGEKPVVIIDYLQVLLPEQDRETKRKATDPKQITDQNITELKRISRSLDIPVFIVSSLNRNNYLMPIDFESFKESGGIEYTADVIWGLQLDILNDEVFNKANDIKAKREKVAKAKEEIPREVELVCLKNRYGKSRYKAKFTYYPQFDYFVCSSEKPSTQKRYV